MKNWTILAAALAAGLTTFAANAREEGRQASMVSAKVEIVKRGERTKDDLIEKDRANLRKAKALVAAKPNKSKGRFHSLIAHHASLNGVSVDLAHAVITVESNYKPNSRGKAGEVGLMQIKPATARMMGYSGSVSGLFDPETNIKYGMKYLGKAKKLSDGSTCGTILKYNAGHGAKRMNPISRAYCNKVKRHLASSRTSLRG
ncbi:MAG TPA: transglycosylase SLT domain-containing protein [Rhizobiaceae bacterium]